MNPSALLKNLPFGGTLQKLWDNPESQGILKAEGKEALLAMSPAGEKAAEILDGIKAFIHLFKGFVALASGNKEAASREFTEMAKSGLVAVERGRMANESFGQRMVEGSLLELGENFLDKHQGGIAQKLAGFLGVHPAAAPVAAPGVPQPGLAQGI